MSEKYLIEVQQVDECFIEIPPELLEKVGWGVGDNIKFDIKKDGSIHLKKVELESVELEFDDDELLKIMMMAHERGETFNGFCENALAEVIKKSEFEDECG
jgi:bifunctional DNA-binding transcriptional regulator/antitoxin component of YhaV-PrlF toxin-antitoxin module